MAAPDPKPLSPSDVETLERIAAAQEEDTIERALAAARDRLGMEAAYVSSVDSERQRVEDVAGDSAALGFGVGTELAVEDTYCLRMLRGEVPNVVPDTRGDPALRELAVSARVGAYVGVPITLPDGSVHGTLCGASSEPNPELGDEELAFMRVLADIVAKRINEAQQFLPHPNGHSGH